MRPLDITEERERMVGLLTDAARSHGFALPTSYVSEAGDLVEYIGGDQWRIGLTIDADPKQCGAHFVARHPSCEGAPVAALQNREDFDPDALIALAEAYEQQA